MALSGLQQLYPYLGAIEKAFDAGSVLQVKPLFRLDNPQLHQALFALTSISDGQLQGACNSKLDAPWSGVVFQHIKAAQHRAEGNPSQAFDLYVRKDATGGKHPDNDGPLKRTVDALVSRPQLIWVAAMFEQLLDNAVVLAREADKQLGLVEEDSKFKALGGFLQPCAHSLGGQQRADEPGRFRGSLSLLITMTRVYTKLNNMQGCTQMLKTFNERYPGNVIQHMPGSTRVAAYFYLGRTEVSSGHILQGLQLLQQAYMECAEDSRNMQTILRFLVPLKMLQGCLPPVELLQRYGLSHYLVFREAIHNGDVGLFQRSMVELTARLVADGTYLLWDMLIFHVYRRLIKRVVDIGRPSRDEKTANHVPLDVVLGALQQQGTGMDMDELECMLTVAINSRYIKGYISNKAKVLVLAKPLSSAFPEACAEWWVPVTAENAVP